MACTHTRTRTHTPGKGIYTEFDFDNAFHPKKKLNIGLRKKKKDEAMKWRRDDENRFTHDFINSPQILLCLFLLFLLYRGVQRCTVVRNTSYYVFTSQTISSWSWIVYGMRCWKFIHFFVVSFIVRTESGQRKKKGIKMRWIESKQFQANTLWICMNLYVVQYGTLLYYYCS